MSGDRETKTADGTSFMGPIKGNVNTTPNRAGGISDTELGAVRELHGDNPNKREGSAIVRRAVDPNAKQAISKKNPAATKEGVDTLAKDSQTTEADGKKAAHKKGDYYAIVMADKDGKVERVFTGTVNENGEIVITGMIDTTKKAQTVQKVDPPITVDRQSISRSQAESLRAAGNNEERGIGIDNLLIPRPRPGQGNDVIPLGDAAQLTVPSGLQGLDPATLAQARQENGKATGMREADASKASAPKVIAVASRDEPSGSLPPL